MIICRTILSGTKLDARSAPAGCAPGMARIKDAKTQRKSRKYNCKNLCAFAPLRQKIINQSFPEEIGIR
jgi:hypothetical protein